MLKLLKPATDGIVHLKVPIITVCPQQPSHHSSGQWRCQHVSTPNNNQEECRYRAYKKIYLMGMSLSSKLRQALLLLPIAICNGLILFRPLFPSSSTDESPHHRWLHVLLQNCWSWQFYGCDATLMDHTHDAYKKKLDDYIMSIISKFWKDEEDLSLALPRIKPFYWIVHLKTT